MSTTPNQHKKQSAVYTAKATQPLRSKTSPEFIAFHVYPNTRSDCFHPGPATLTSVSGKQYPVTLVGFSMFVGGGPDYTLITTIAHNLEPLEDTYTLVQDVDGSRDLGL